MVGIMSFIQKENSHGPRIQFWENPEKAKKEIETEPLRRRHYIAYHLGRVERTVDGKTYDRSLLRSVEWLIESNAFGIS